MTEKYPTEAGESRYLIDEIILRLDKLECERVYCNQFLEQPFQIKKIEASIGLIKKVQQNGVMISVTSIKDFNIKMPEMGYPKNQGGIKTLYPDFEGSKIANSLGSLI